MDFVSITHRLRLIIFFVDNLPFYELPQWVDFVKFAQIIG